MKRLGKKFFARPALIVAEELIGTLLIHQLESGHRLITRIVETEAYGENDPACHAHANWLRQKVGKKVTGRSALLFGPPGYAYVYLNYGMHWLFNVVVDQPGTPAAVLIRAGEPVEGLEWMLEKRPKACGIHSIANGPGKFAAAMAINSTFNGKSLLSGPLFFAEEKSSDHFKNFQTQTSPRIGISKAQELEWRFFSANHPSVSK